MFGFLFRRKRAAPAKPQPKVPVPGTATAPNTPADIWSGNSAGDVPYAVASGAARPGAQFGPEVRRYFHNQRGFQCYTSWFAHWDGWISAGHCVTDAAGHVADFATGETLSWPDGLDAALVGCSLPSAPPSPPRVGQSIIMAGYPAGSRTAELRTGTVYHERSAGQWIAHIHAPDEPVVTGMSGGPVYDAETGVPIGIVITRNSPADLNNDRDPDESADFIALSAVWTAIQEPASA